MADQMDGKGRPPKRRSRLTRGQKGLIAAAAVLAVALAGLSGCDSAYLFACVGEKESQRIFGL